MLLLVPTLSPCNKTMSTLPPELVMDILSLLPIKDLLRFKSVCKPWYQLITNNPHFAQLQFNQSKKSENSILILNKVLTVIGEPKSRTLRSYFFCSADVHDLEYPKNIIFPFDDNNFPFNTFHHIISSCNGILCFAIFREEFTPNYIFNVIPNSSFFLWNPSTNKYLTVPCPPIPDEHKKHSDKIYYFDPKYGFGFHPVSNEYKLVRILGFRSLQCNAQLSVYTLGEDCWRVLGDIPYVVKSLPKLCNTLVNGTLHWEAKRFGSDGWDFILSFDIRDECIREIQLPAGVSSHLVENETVSELGGLLCYTFQVKETKEIHVWVMKEYGMVDTWTEQYIFELPEVANWSHETYVEPLCMVNDEEVLFIKGGTHHMFVYNPRDNSVRKRKGCCTFTYHQFFPHVRSLFWPTVSSDCDETEKGMRLGSSCSDPSSVKGDGA